MKIINARFSGSSYGEISRKFGIGRSSVVYIIKSFGKFKSKTGMKTKIDKYDCRDIVKEIENSFKNNAKCSASDVRRRLSLDASLSTVQRTLRYMKYVYTDVRRKFYLSNKSKLKRLEIAKQFLSNHRSWHDVIFSDEKLFTLNGCDSYKCWIQKGRSPKRIKKVLKSPGVMIWAMVFPNGLLSYEIMTGRQCSTKYIDILKSKAIPLIKLNYPNQMTFQQDNAPIHTSKLTSDYFRNSNINVLPWPPYSPDINLIENIWFILSQYVYDGVVIKSISGLKLRIKDAVRRFNEENKETVNNLYNSMNSRLVNIICKRGDRINY